MLKKLGLILLLLLLPAFCSAADKTVGSAGADYTQVGTALTSHAFMPGDTITLITDVTEANKCLWGNMDDGAAGVYVTLDLNSYTWDMTAADDYILGLAATTYTRIKGPGTVKTTASTNGAIEISGGNNIIIENCTIEYVAGDWSDSGIRLRASADTTTIQRVIFTSLTADSGVGVFVRDDSNNTTVKYCLFNNCSRGVYFYDVDGVNPPTGLFLYNNTLYDYDLAGLWIDANTDASEVTARNNIFYGDGSCNGVDDDGANEADLNYNCYYNNATDVAGSSSVGGNGLANTDPLMVDPANGNYRLQALSPCRDNGDATLGLTSDITGRLVPLGSAPDIGAYEYMKPRWWRFWR